MSSVENCQRILEAIDQLRRRKARPDRKRICNYVCRRHCISPMDVVVDLERLVDEQTVIKVEYKGNISYRNAAKWAKLSVHKSRVEVDQCLMSKVERIKTETERMTYALRGAVSALIVKEREFLLHGVPAQDLVQYLQAKDAEFFVRVSFTTLVERELASGNIVKLLNGNYSFRPIAATMRLALSPMASPMASPAGSDDGNTTNKDSRIDDDMEPFADSKMSTSPSQSWPDDESKPGLDGDPDQDPDVELDVNSPSAPSSPIATNPGASPTQDQADPVHDLDDQANDPEPATTEQSATDPSNADAVEAAEGGGYRAGERRKRAKKKVFDPSDNNIPTGRKRGRPAGTFKNAKHDENGNKEKPEAPPVILGPICALCNAEIKDTKSTPCRDCTKKAHTSCYQKSLKNATKARPGPWQCSMCKTCQMCSQTKESGNMAVCCSCDEAYHVKCLTPRPKLPLKKWLCSQCSPPPPPPPEPKSAASTPDRSPLRGRGPPVLVPAMLPTALSPIAADVYGDLNDSAIDESIPDSSEWTPDQVHDYFLKLFPDHAKVFKEQDIDGRSLVLMTRQDVVSGLGLKLGPALKLYGQVKRLQLRRSERHLLWE